MTEKRIEIGIVAAAHGIRGQVKLRSFAACPEDIFTYELTDESGAIREIKPHGRIGELWIASISGVTDRNAAEALKGQKLYVAAHALPDSGEDDWYYSELIGLEARLASGEAYGNIIAVHNFGAGDIIELALADGTQEMLPFTDAFVPEIHKDKGYVCINPPQYLEPEPKT